MPAVRIVSAVTAVVLSVVAPSLKAETHWDLQAVDQDGYPVHPKVGAEPEAANLVVLEGIALNNPEDMLDPAGQWQVFVQGEGGDLGGTSVWAGAWYQSSLWQDELDRLNDSGFREGDRIRVTGYAMAVGGKANINERHSAAPEMDFTVELLEAGIGLPAPEPTTVAEFNDFDPTRLTGGERYQNRRIRLERVSLEGGATAWGANTTLTIVDPDDSSETVPLKLCNTDFGSRLPATWFNVVGLGNQEPQFAGPPVPGTGLTDGYEVWVTRADGIEAPGDCNLDGMVDGGDLAIMATHWNDTDAGWGFGDFTGEGVVDGADLALMASNWNYGPVDGEITAFEDAAAAYGLPEPGVLLLLLGASPALLHRRTTRQHTGLDESL